jgi:hypothetical protein
VTREPGRWIVHVPGLDTLLMEQAASAGPAGPLEGLSRLFWERMELRVDSEGALQYRLLYGSHTHAAIHAFLTVALAIDYLGAPERGLAGLLTAWCVLNAIPWATSVLALHGSRWRALRILAGSAVAA